MTKIRHHTGIVDDAGAQSCDLCGEVLTPSGLTPFLPDLEVVVELHPGARGIYPATLEDLAAVPRCVATH